MDTGYLSELDNAYDAFVTEYAGQILRAIRQTEWDRANLPAELFSLLTGGKSDLLSLRSFLVPLASALLLLWGLQYGRRLFPSRSAQACIYIANLVLTVFLTVPSYRLLLLCMNYMRDLSAFFNTLIPIFGTVYAACGNVVSAASENLLLLWTFSIVQILLNGLLPAVIRFFLCYSVFCAAAGEDSWYSLSDTLKKALYWILSVGTTLLFLLIGFQSVVAANADSASARAMKLLISGAVPIVGGTLGDALRVVGGGLAAVKSALGTAAVLFILAMFLPVLFLLWAARMLLALFSSLLSEKKPVLQLQNVFDLALAVYATVTVLFTVNAGVFLSIKPVVVGG